MSTAEQVLAMGVEGRAAYVSMSGESHRVLMSMPSELYTRLDLVVGHRSSYDLQFLSVPSASTAAQLGAAHGMDASERRFVASVQPWCSPDDARLLQFLAQFVPVDVLGGCALHVTWNTRHGRRLIDAGEPGFAVLTDYELALITTAGEMSDDAIVASLWAALSAGAVPVYWGSQGLVDALPDPDCAISASAFASPIHLAAHLQELFANRSMIQKHHLWRLRPRQCVWGDASPLCRALDAQVPGVLTWEGLSGLIESRLVEKEPEARYLGGSRFEADKFWHHACAACDLTLEKFGQLEKTTEVRLVAEGEVLVIKKPYLPHGALELQPQTSYLLGLWEDLRVIFDNPSLFRGKSVLQLALRPRDALPFAGLASWLHGGARSVLLHAPRNHDVLAEVSALVNDMLGEDIVRVSVQEDFRQSRSKDRRTPAHPTTDLWLEAGYNEFLMADTVLALGGTLPQIFNCFGLQSMKEVVGLLRHVTRKVLVLEWSVSYMPEVLAVDGGYSYEALASALQDHFVEVLVIGRTQDGGVLLMCLGVQPDDAGWPALRVSEAPVPKADACAECEIATSAFIWAGEVFSKRVFLQGELLVKSTSTLMALKEALFLDVFAPEFECVPRLAAHRHGRWPGNDGEGTWWTEGGWWSEVVMEYVRGISFEDYLDSIRVAGDVERLLLACLELLRCLRSRGVQHNDLWAPNLKVLDLGSGAPLRLVALDLGAARLQLPGGLDEDDLDRVRLEDGEHSLVAAMTRAREFIKHAGVTATSLPQLVPSFVVDVGAHLVAVEPRSDRHMIGALLQHHLQASPRLREFAAPYGHVVQALTFAHSWSLAAVRELLVRHSTSTGKMSGTFRPRASTPTDDVMRQALLTAS